MSKVLRIMLAAIAFAGTFVLLSVAAYANPSITNLTMDRSEVAPGQNINISVRTSPDVNYVFSITDGIRNQGVRVSTDAAGNHNWLVSINPMRTTNAVVFANTINMEGGAASITMPVSVRGTTPAGTPDISVHTPAGPLDIVHIAETPAVAAGEVRLTVVTGLEVGAAWVEFDDGRFATGEMVSQDATTRTWVISFAPSRLQPQTVRVGANRTFIWPGASLRDFQVTLAQPHIAPPGNIIQQVIVTPRDVAAGGRVTVTIRTAPSIGAVWLRDTAGWEHNARALPGHTPTSRLWEVSFNPMHTGTITIFANVNRAAMGAVQHVEHITVGGGGITHILDAVTVPFGAGTAQLTLHTSPQVQTAWVVTGNQQVVQLSLTSAAGIPGTRTWTSGSTPLVMPLTVRVSSQAGANVHNLRIDSQIHLATLGRWDGATARPPTVPPILPAPPPTWPAPPPTWPAPPPTWPTLPPNWPSWPIWPTPQILNANAIPVAANQVRLNITTNQFVESMWVITGVSQITNLQLTGPRTGHTRTFTGTITNFGTNLLLRGSIMDARVAPQNRSVDVEITIPGLSWGGPAIPITPLPRVIHAFPAQGTTANMSQVFVQTDSAIQTVWGVTAGGDLINFSTNMAHPEMNVFASSASIPRSAFPLTVRGSTTPSAGAAVQNLQVDAQTWVADPNWSGLWDGLDNLMLYDRIPIPPMPFD